MTYTTSTLTLRPITPSDLPFLQQVYASTRTEEMAILDWDASQKDEFLAMQFHAQHTFDQDQFTSADFNIILHDDKPVGRLYIDRREHEIRIIDIALLAEYRNQGIGSVFMHCIIDEARGASLPVRIHVEKTNPAMQWYQRLGFTKIDDAGVYDLMEWNID